MPRKHGITIVDKINVLKAKFDSLTKTERSEIKSGMEDILTPFSNQLFHILKENTPERREDSDIYEFRLKAWEKYGYQDYLRAQSPYPAERMFGITLKNGWMSPIFDYSGSATNRIQVNYRFGNRAPQAPLVLLGEYKKENWDIPGASGLRGGRRVMMWEGTNGPVFVWDVNGPVNYRRPKRPLDYIVEYAKSELISTRDNLIESIKTGIRKEMSIE